MAKGFGKRLAHALAIGVGAGMEGYGKGSLDVAMRAREEYQQRLKDERAAAAAGEERAWREGQSEKDREFEREMFQEKLSAAETSDERKLQNQLKIAELRKSGGGKGGGGSSAVKETAKMKEARFLAAAKYGANPTDAQVAEFMTAKPAGSKGSTTREPTSIQEARFKARAKYGEGATDAQVAEFLDKETSSSGDKVTIPQYASMIDKEVEGLTDILNPDRIPADEARKVATESVNKRLLDMGVTPPGYKGQQSVAEVEQPQTEQAPPTSTLGEKPTDATPIGEGTEKSPYVVENEAQKAWVLSNAPPGSYVAYGGKVIRKK